ncbi:serine/threonine-protein kinase [Streptomyces sp. NPDC059740]|uniref:serine/threonine-protein kinase n=1 Tax=Streptomyces sp. NPDC059740 TaxID=3346926 RepID=UPI0036501F72
MTTQGGRADEPSVYELHPPQGPAAPPHAPGAAPGPGRPVRQVPPRPAGQPAREDPRASAGPSQDTATATLRSGEDPAVGRRVGGRYRLLRRLGHGGMGTVWVAHDEVVDREVAVKEPRLPDSLPAAAARTVHERMRREARAAARIEHPQVVTVHDVVVEDGRPWIVMELVRGTSLGDRLREGTLDVREAARVGEAVLAALGAAHTAGVLHRDVKPDNILISGEDRVVLTDFGIARVEGEQGLTETGGFVGSPEFTAPERVLGQRPGPASDLWSLGVVLYTAVEGVSPFRRSNSQATLQAVLSAEPQPPSRAAGEFAALVMQLLHKDPAARPPAEQVRRVLHGAAFPAPAVPPRPASQPAVGPAPANRWVPPVLHRNRRAQATLGAGVLVVAAALVLLLADPFTGNGLPEGWQQWPSDKVTQASVAAPANYLHTVEPDGNTETFSDRSGVYSIELNLTVHDPRDTFPVEIGSARAEAAELAHENESGEDRGSGMYHAKSTLTSSQQQGQKAYDVTTDYTESSSDDDDVVHYVKKQHLYVHEGRQRWTLTVTMPAEGDARPGGDALYAKVLEYLRIDGLGDGS